MHKILKRINQGFLNKDPYLVYKNIKDYFESNSNDVKFKKHPLGFIFYNLGHLSDSEEFRIHIWDKNYYSQDDDLQIHNHSFDFESFVVIGKIENVCYQLNEDSQSFGYKYQVKFVDNKSFLDLLSHNIKIEIISKEFISAGKFYKLFRSEFHESYNLDPFSITLIKIVKPESFNPPIVYSPKKIKNYLSFNRSDFSNDESKLIINKIIEVCKERLTIL